MRTLNFGIIGTNFISDRFCDAVRRTENARAVAVYSRGAESGAAFAARNGLERAYTSLEALMNDDNIDAVYIASPTMLHREHALAALEHRKHVLCEKTIALNGAELAEMKAAAERTGCALVEAMRSDFDPAFEAVERALPSLGRIRRASFDFRQYSSRYDAFKEGRVLNAFDPNMKNSALSDIGIYPLHLAVRLLGDPREVEARSRFLENGFEGAGEVTLGYEGFEAKIRYSKIEEGENVSFIEGERGTIRFGKINAPQMLSIKIDGTELASYEPEENNMRAEVDGFCAATRDEARSAELIALTERVMHCYERVAKSAGIFYTL